MSYATHILTMIALYVILGLSMNLVSGFSGRLSLCHAAFYGVGAYTYSLLVKHASLHFWLALPAAMASSGIIASLIGCVALHVRGDFFTMVTLGFQIIVFVVLHNWGDVTNGPYGIVGIPRPTLLGYSLNSSVSMLVLTATCSVLVWMFCVILADSPFGRTLRAVRDDELAAESLGKSPFAFALAAFVISGTCAGMAGGLFAAYTSYIDPSSFTLDESLFILCIVIIGGSGTIHGPVVGAVILVTIPEFLRFLGLPSSSAASLRQIIYGLVLVLMMRLRPQGIAGSYAFE